MRGFGEEFVQKTLAIWKVIPGQFPALASQGQTYQ